MEGILFLASCVLLVVTGYLYIKREDNDFKILIEKIKDVQAVVTGKNSLTTEVINRLHERIDAVEIKVIDRRAPHNINVTLPPVKVLIKQVPVSTVNPQILKIKKQLKSL